MPERPENCFLSVPEDVIGFVCGELSNGGGLIVAMNNDAGIYEVRAEMPMGLNRGQTGISSQGMTLKTIADQDLWRDRVEKMVPDTFFAFAAFQTLIPPLSNTKIPHFNRRSFLRLPVAEEPE